MAERARERAGFTLIEVLGAVAVMGIAYALLASTAIQSVRAIGQSGRRIDASLIADEKLSEIELAAELGQLIELRDEETEDGEFRIHVEVLDSSELYDAEPGSEPSDLMGFLASEAQRSLPVRQSNWLLGYLREVHVTVSWDEGENEIQVHRTAFVYDQQQWMDDNGEAAAARNQSSQSHSQTTRGTNGDTDDGGDQP